MLGRAPAGPQALRQRREAHPGAEVARQVAQATVGAQHEARRPGQARTCVEESQISVRLQHEEPGRM